MTFYYNPGVVPSAGVYILLVLSVKENIVVNVVPLSRSPARTVKEGIERGNSTILAAQMKKVMY